MENGKNWRVEIRLRLSGQSTLAWACTALSVYRANVTHRFYPPFLICRLPCWVACGLRWHAEYYPAQATASERVTDGGEDAKASATFKRSQVLLKKEAGARAQISVGQPMTRAFFRYTVVDLKEPFSFDPSLSKPYV